MNARIQWRCSVIRLEQALRETITPKFGAESMELEKEEEAILYPHYWRL